MRRGKILGDFPVTTILFILCLIFYVLEAHHTGRVQEMDLLQSLTSMEQVVPWSLGVNSYDALREGQLWRLIAHAFLHGDALHIVLSLLVILDLGRICEPLLGRERFAVAYIASAVAGGLASAGWDAVRGVLGGSVGSSGALFGMMGLLLAFGLRYKDTLLREQMIRWVIYVVLFTLVLPAVDHAGHAGGFVLGAAFGFFTPRYVSSQSARAWRIPFWIAVALTAVSLGIALWSFVAEEIR